MTSIFRLEITTETGFQRPSTVTRVNIEDLPEEIITDSSSFSKFVSGLNSYDKLSSCPALNSKCKHCGKIGHYTKAEFDKVIAEDFISAVNEPSDWVNSIVCKIKETPDEQKKVKLAWTTNNLTRTLAMNIITPETSVTSYCHGYAARTFVCCWR